jgi:hypothetical protein
MEKGVQISVWARITVQLDGVIPMTWTKMTSSATAMMISGSTSGSITKPSIAPLPRNSAIAPARAARMPSTVAKIAVKNAMKSEFCTALISAVFSDSAANHLVEKPSSGKAMIVPELKAKSGSRMIGA